MTGEAVHIFILRVSRNASGRVRGVLERVRTGEKVPVQELGMLGSLVGQMLAAEQGDRRGREDRARSNVTDDELP